MIYTDLMLKKQYENYANPAQKIALEAKKGNMVRIKKGIYSSSPAQDGLALANFCYGPSYVSFEYALSYYGLIPEYVSLITSATMNKNKRKRFVSSSLILEYRDVPAKAFPLFVELGETASGYRFRIASKEKALCDLLYAGAPIRSIQELKTFLFNNLRIDEEGFSSLDKEVMLTLCPLYQSTTLKTLQKLIGGR